jgi:hypothetical protein
MASTYTLIAGIGGAGNPYTIGSGGVATATLSSIPATYTDLKLLISARHSDTSIGDIAIRFNSDTGSNYSYVEGYGVGTGTPGGGKGSSVARHNTIISGTNSTTSTFNNVEINIIDYASTSRAKISIVDAVLENMASTSEIQMRIQGWSWNNTSTAINSITIFSPTYNLLEFSTIYLYGISNA